jgi:hypothetical protein
MISTFLLLGCIATSQSSDLPLESEQYARIWMGTQEGIRDVSLVYEGKMEMLGPQEVPLDERVSRTLRFQGTFLYRFDGATSLDLYERTTDDSSLSRSRGSLLRGTVEQLDLAPDSRAIPQLTSGPGGPGRLNFPCSFYRLFFYWHLRAAASSPISFYYEYIGWENIDGHHCLKIKLNISPGDPGPSKRFFIMWIDLKRGGHPLRIEWHDGEATIGIVHSVVLDSFTQSNAPQLWMPTSGIADFYLYGNKCLKEVVTRETYQVVKRSVSFNQKLADQVFSVKWKGLMPSSDVLGLRKEFDIASKVQKPRLRTDPKSVQEQLDAQLTKANKQSSAIEASSVARESWGNAFLLQATPAALGVLLLGAAAFIWRRSSR